ncbi:GerAB/ArcD/ProY family transporter [Paenibacillus sp. HJGM_3]|uniref:GerAB/ArcD/ProY family transporter n=1 Tax=Paenibacillus sp. HJGM_3 TaxID=3379816 RepID=UPI0038591BED
MKENIEPFHLAILVHMTQTGVVILSLPEQLARYFGYNGWIILFLVSLVAVLNMGLIALVYRYGGRRSIFDIMEQSISKWLLAPLYIALAAVWSLAGVMVAKQYVLIFQMMAFPTTHPMLLMFLIELLTFLLLIKGIFSITRAATVFFWLFFWMVFLLMFYYKDFNWSRLTPFLLHGEGPYVKGFLNVYNSFIGYELSLLLLPFVSTRPIFTPMFMGNLLTTISYVSICFFCFGFFSLDYLKKSFYPTLGLLAYVRFPFVERLENLLYGIFLFTVIITIVMYTWASQQALERLVPRVPSKWLSFIIILVVYGVAWIPKVMSEVQLWLRTIGYIETGVAFGLPLLLLVFLLFQRGNRVSENA